MTDLIPLRTTKLLDTDAPVQTVDARALHAFLGVDSHFKDWVARRLATYGLVEGQDFRSFLSETGGRPSKEYQLTLDTAKELAMVERTAKGREARRYFISCERRLRERELAVVPTPVLATTAAIGDSSVARRDVDAFARLAAKSRNVTLHRVHGAIRRAMHAPGIYQVPLVLVEQVKSILKELALGTMLLPGKPATLHALPSATRQQELFG